jgi:hypothetical protein
MYLILLIVLLLLSLIIIALGFYRQEHAELGIAGFLFLFLLSFIFISGSVQYKVGVNETNTYSCLCCEFGQASQCPYDNQSSIVVTAVEKVDVYATWDAGGMTSHWVGYVLAVISVTGMIGTFISIKREDF